MKKTLAIMMVLVMVMGYAFAVPAPQNDSVVFTLNAKPAEALTKIGFTDQNDIDTKNLLSTFSKSSSLYLNASAWDAPNLPLVDPEKALELVTSDPENGLQTYKLPGKLGVWVVARNCGGTLSVSATPLKVSGTYDVVSETTDGMQLTDDNANPYYQCITEIPYKLTVGSGLEVTDIAAGNPCTDKVVGDCKLGDIKNGCQWYYGGITITADNVTYTQLIQDEAYSATLSAKFTVQ